ncbi:NAD(P)-binding protein [Mytilinidion resinicola]|uniref:NAD(P)-binding protein n=1 Tax=Mytilinidion resinicola TaxID=574789 RepID=A0A6A6Z9S7_9PEZI|nr:NAD(P)-binding protein [Mytilinidion resinicola]KAF2816967.1 NAD(P)-binding protein [Mytilinidion resinicola]
MVRARRWALLLLATVSLTTARELAASRAAQLRLQHDYPNLFPAVGNEPSKFDPLLNSLEELHHALETMQSDYFKIWLGKWPDAIDWTAAVMGTHVSAALYSLTRSLEYIMPGTYAEQGTELKIEGQRVENEINKYFSQAITYFFGEDHFAIRTQAHDDMLWVVLGWLENIRFIREHNSLHYPPTSDSTGGSRWYGKQFEGAFAHRARVFYDLAKKGWDWKLCGGGMTWDPHKAPYKNAITNELFIAASIGMYLYFPGDSNCSPFMSTHDGLDDDARIAEEGDGVCEPPYGPAPAHDPIYLQSAVNGYKWLKNSNMTNTKGLYVDGFHIRDWGKNHTIGTGNCDERNEMVYTYNQGVLLSGLRGLWEGTGDLNYLDDGHKLVRDAIRATGWRPGHGLIVEDGKWWFGLGKDGILTETCDPLGTCSQNGQTFKGIFFHHLTLFCKPLPLSPLIPGKTHGASKAVAKLHRQSCKEYAPWVARNAQAALRTRDKRGRFGGWWGALSGKEDEARLPETPDGAVDYRNRLVRTQDKYEDTPRESGPDVQFATMQKKETEFRIERMKTQGGDLNDRGRGRTVETQGGGVAVRQPTKDRTWKYLTLDLFFTSLKSTDTTMSSKNIIVILGITGNQGGSVATEFLNHPNWTIRGISRSPSSARSAAWTAKGVAMVAADLNDTDSLEHALKGATAIFGVTDYWQHFWNPANRVRATETGQTLNEISYELEVQQGKNLVDAAASVEGLDRLVLSTLSKSREWSHGRITWNYHSDAKWAAVEYMRERYPELAARSSLLQAAVFMENYRKLARKQTDGSYKIRCPIKADTPVPMIDHRADTGHFVKALLDVAPGKNLAAHGSLVSWSQFCQLASKLSGVTFTYEQCTVDDFDVMILGGAGREIGEMFVYTEDPGYYGADPSITNPENLGVNVQTKSIETFLKEDLPSFLKQ